MKNLLFAPKWNELISQELEKDYYQKMMSFLDEEYAKGHVTPKKENVFKALKLTDFSDVKVVILGQDPYPEKDVANGLAFGTDSEKVPKTLIAIFKTLATELWLEGKYNNALDAAMDLEGTSLEGWARQGVLLLNSSLTTEVGKTGSHRKIGWDKFISRILKFLIEKEERIVFLLWGQDAASVAEKAGIFNQNKHVVLKCSHPSSISGKPKDPFDKARHFHLTNKHLENFGLDSIDWTKIS